MAKKVKVANMSWGATGHAPVDSAKISNNQGVHQGKMIGFKMVISDCPNAITFTLGIKDSDGDTIYTSSGQAKNGTRIVMGLDVPLVEQERVTIDPSGDAGVGGVTVSNITLYYHPDVVTMVR